MNLPTNFILFPVLLVVDRRLPVNSTQGVTGMDVRLYWRALGLPGYCLYYEYPGSIRV
jgi:hypothetical protein